jgi:hypothetical protein
MTPCGRPSLRGGDACLRTVINFGPVYLILILAIGFQLVSFAFAQNWPFLAVMVRHAPASHPPPLGAMMSKILQIFFSPFHLTTSVFRSYFMVQFRKNMRCGNKLRRCCCERADLQRHAHGNVALSVRSHHFSTIPVIVVLLFICNSNIYIFTCCYGSKLSAIPPHLLVAQQQCCC